MPERRFARSWLEGLKFQRPCAVGTAELKRQTVSSSDIESICFGTRMKLFGDGKKMKASDTSMRFMKAFQV